MVNIPFARSRSLELAQGMKKVDPGCDIFTDCGGCVTLDLSYEDELQIKEKVFLECFDRAGLKLNVMPIVSSPKSSGYRNKISPQFKTLRNGEFIFGMAPFGKKQIVNMERCPMAEPKISEALLQIREALIEKSLPPRKRGCAVIRYDQKQLHWGGWGKGSLRMKPDDYFCFKYNGHRIHYTLDSFFQLNTYILGPLLDHLNEELNIDASTHLFDLYGGVGLFSFCLGAKAGKVTLLELEGRSTEIANYNREVNCGFDHLSIVCGAVEKTLPLISQTASSETVAIIDPPRAGLRESVIETLHKQPPRKLAYLSCNPETQARDMKCFMDLAWKCEAVTPYDFFPRTHHIESLAILSPPH